MLFKKKSKVGDELTLNKIKKNIVYTVSHINSDDKLKEFLLTLGCYENQEIVLVSKLSGNYIVNIKDSRFALDEKMAKSIILKK